MGLTASEHGKRRITAKTGFGTIASRSGSSPYTSVTSQFSGTPTEYMNLFITYETPKQAPTFLLHLDLPTTQVTKIGSLTKLKAEKMLHMETG